jgi:hypothetical protein
MKNRVSKSDCYNLVTLSGSTVLNAYQIKPRIKWFPQFAVAGMVAVLATLLMGQRAHADSYTNVIPAGNSLIANQLDHGSNTADVVFPNPTGSLDSCSILKWNCTSFTTYYFDSASPSGFDDNNFSPVAAPMLNPGEAFFFNNQFSPFSLTFTGTPHVPVLPAALPCGYGQPNYLSRQTNDVGTYENIIGLSPTQGALERIWNGATFATYTYTNGAWAPTNPPSLAVGQGAVFTVPSNTIASGTLQLNIARTNSNVVLTWTNTGVALESAPTLPGTWSVVTGAVSPRVISPTNPAGFFRLHATTNAPLFAFLYVAPTFSSSIGDPFGCGCVSPENPNTLGAVGGAQDNGMGSVLLQTGELTQDGVALAIPGRGFDWRCEFRYRSGMSYNGPLGKGGWDFNYNRRLAVQTNGNVLCINGLGRVDAYIHNLSGTFTVTNFFDVVKIAEMAS